jgi:hypothetical protein
MQSPKRRAIDGLPHESIVELLNESIKDIRSCMQSPKRRALEGLPHESIVEAVE